MKYVRLAHRVWFISIAMAMLIVVKAGAQNPRLMNGLDRGKGAFQKQRNDADSIDEKTVPKGIFVWSVDERFGSVRPQQPDTLMTHFQNHNYTEGKWGDHNFTGNLGGPRVSRIYEGSLDNWMNSQFVFLRPYDWFLQPIDQFFFTNTKSPIATLNYDMAGSKVDGDDHLTARFATNVNKRAGIGFTADYIYGQGFYRNNNHSSLGGNLYASYRGDRYQLHMVAGTHHIKNLENGGLEDDAYVNNPAKFSTNYSPADMPVRLERVRNTINFNRLFLSHRYAVGFYEYRNPKGELVSRQERNSLLKNVIPTDSNEIKTLADTTLNRRFIPVAAAIHSLKVLDGDRRFSDQAKHDTYFANHYFPSTQEAVREDLNYLSVQNTFALEMQEGFRSWVKTGMRLFAKHELARFTLPELNDASSTSTIHYISLGVQLLREKARILRYNVLGEMRTTGKDWGEFNLEGHVGLNFPFWADSLLLKAGGYVRNQQPSYFLQHHHGRNAWWDKQLDKMLQVRLEGSLSYRRTRFLLGIESLQNYVYLQEQQVLGDGENSPVKYGVDVRQTQKNIQVFSAALHQDFTFGIFNWENRITLQKSSEESKLPLPLINVWSNVYLRFKIAGILRTELGADVRYFTAYHAPTYSVAVGQYAVQDTQQPTSIGNYPWGNAYLNFLLKGVRFYFAYSHLNQGAGNYFLVPHYPTNERVLRFGLSWTFFN